MEFGRIAPTEPQKEQVNGDGWAWRYKVRIFSKHPEDKSILADEDLAVGASIITSNSWLWCS